MVGRDVDEPQTISHPFEISVKKEEEWRNRGSGAREEGGPRPAVITKACCDYDDDGPLSKLSPRIIAIPTPLRPFWPGRAEGRLWAKARPDIRVTAAVTAERSVLILCIGDSVLT